MKLLLALLLLIPIAHATESDLDVSSYAQGLAEQSRFLGRLPVGAQNRGCEERYARLWKDGVLHIDWYYGFLDLDKVVLDRVVREQTFRALEQPCRAGGAPGACGFRVVSDASRSYGPLTLEKKLADGRRVVIRGWTSSVNDYVKNDGVGPARIAMPTAEQLRKSHAVRNAFLHSIANSEVVIYDGHSRYGSGPGFRPYNLAQIVKGALFRPSWESTLSAVRGAAHPPEVMMFASCLSEKYYLSDLRRAAPDMAIVSTAQEQTMEGGEETVMGLVDSLVVGRCERGIVRSLHSTHADDGKMDVSGFDR